jgi:hypothetical protein
VLHRPVELADAAGNVFVNIDDTSEIVQLDAKLLTIKARWPPNSGQGSTHPARLTVIRAIGDRYRPLYVDESEEWNRQLLVDGPIW